MQAATKRGAIVKIATVEGFELEKKVDGKEGEEPKMIGVRIKVRVITNNNNY